MFLKSPNPYKCKHFDIRELLPQQFYKVNMHYGDLLWNVFCPRALKTIDLLREFYGGIIINNWLWNGTFDESGLRIPGTTTGVHLSQHKYGRAFDCKFKDTTAEKVRADLYAIYQAGDQAIQSSCFRFITCIEDFEGMNWFHFDTRNHEDGLLVVRG